MAALCGEIRATGLVQAGIEMALGIPIGGLQEDVIRLFIVVHGERATNKKPKLKKLVSDWIKELLLQEVNHCNNFSRQTVSILEGFQDLNIKSPV